MKRLVRDRNTVEMLEAFEGKLDELKSSTEVEGSTLFDDWKDDPDLIDGWEKLESKSVPDFDGFYTEYSLWFNHGTGEYATLFGDTDLYNPSNKDFDAEFGRDANEAYEWFENYNGFEDDDI